MGTIADIAGSFLPFNINNAKVPPEGPRAVRIPLNFSTVTSYVADLTTLTQGQPNPQMSYIQTLFVDNSNNAGSLQILTGVTNQNVVIPPYSQGFVPILQPNNPKITFTSSASGDATCQVFALNFPVSPAVWSVEGNGTFYFNGQSLKVTDVILDALVGNYNGYGSAMAVADLGLQSLISGGALKVSGGGGSGSSPDNLFFVQNQGIGAANNVIIGTAGKQIVFGNLSVWVPPDIYSSNAAGDAIFVTMEDQSTGDQVWQWVLNVPGAAPSAYSVNANTQQNNAVNFALSVAANLKITTSTFKGSTITSPTYTSAYINIAGTYLLQ